MAVTVSGKNYTQISSCDSISAGGTWSGGNQDTASYKEGSASLSYTMKSSGLNSWTFTPSSSVDMSGTKHLRIWFLDSAPGLLATMASGGIQIGVSDGSNTGYWYLGGSDTYDGGWINLVIDVSSNVDNGTKPTNMNAITSIIIRINQTAGGKNFDNVWIDNLNLCDGLVVSGDDGGGYFDFEDIYQGDANTSLGIGIIRKIGGVYYLVGEIDFGLASSATKFQALSQTVVFEDRPVSASLYSFNVVDDGSNTTEFILGSKSGTAGIQGCSIRVQSDTQSAKFGIDGSTDTDVDNFKLYGSVFYGAGQISFPASAANVEILSCSFEKCEQVIASTASIRECFFINTSDADAALLWNDSINIQDCSFIGNTTGAGIEMPAATGSPYTYTNLTFTNNTYDVYNSSGSAITINNSGSNGSTYEGSSVTFVSNPVTTQITVKDLDTTSEIENALVLVWVTDNANYFYQASVTITGSGTTATVAHTAHGLSTGDNVIIAGANEDVYNGAYTITKINDNSYSYTTNETITVSPATGTILATMALINELTNSSGIANDSRPLTNNQAISGRVRKSSSSPYYKQGIITGTVDSSNGFSTIIQLARDE